MPDGDLDLPQGSPASGDDAPAEHEGDVSSDDSPPPSQVSSSASSTDEGEAGGRASIRTSEEVGPDDINTQVRLAVSKLALAVDLHPLYPAEEALRLKDDDAEAICRSTSRSS